MKDMVGKEVFGWNEVGRGRGWDMELNLLKYEKDFGVKVYLWKDV